MRQAAFWSYIKEVAIHDNSDPVPNSTYPREPCQGGTLVVHLSAFDAAFLLEIPTGQRAWSDVGIHLVLRLTIVWNATAGLPCFMKQDRWAAMKPWA